MISLTRLATGSARWIGLTIWVSFLALMTLGALAVLVVLCLLHLGLWCCLGLWVVWLHLGIGERAGPVRPPGKD